ncbi:MAG: anthranilate synthase component I family protein [Crocinitomicaceae bacterium]
MFDFPLAYLNSNDGTSLLAFGKGELLICNSDDSINEIQLFVNEHQGEFIFSCLAYDLKNEIEKLNSENFDGMQFPKALLWVPECIVEIENDDFHFTIGENNQENETFVKHFIEEKNKTEFRNFPFQLKPRTSREDYLSHVNQLKEEIQQGNIYEINYCQEYYSENVALEDSLNAYFKLNSITKSPYSAYFNIDDFVLMCGSPERFIQRKADKLSSSPIKGTSKRGKNTEEDELLKKQLFNDPKERSENVMIVDLVRNDLSKIALNDSVKVDELFGIHTFETVHQMISTISCEIPSETTFSEILHATFPMGSMTGAPKVSAMKLIEKHEEFKRGLYSGSVGLLAPNGDFDFNVVIRSIQYNKKEKYLSCSVGGAITIQSSAEKEFEECNVKIQGILSKMNA